MMTTEFNVLLTWHARIVHAVAASSGCSTKVRRARRVIGGRVTTKEDRFVALDGPDGKVALATGTVEHLIAELNARSDEYARSLPEGLSPTQRKVARRSWLEREAAAIEHKLSGGNNG